MHHMNNEIRTYDMSQLKELMEELDQPSFRARQLYEWLHIHLATSYEEMTNLPLSLREQLSKSHPLVMPHVIDTQLSKDGSAKYILELEDKTRIETVSIPSFDKNKDIKKLTACVSTQVGCPMECLFCATGQEGFARNLKAHEIVDQIIAVQKDYSDHITNVVVMGQGEPFLNYDEVLRALRVINDPNGFKIGARHITVSSCGILSGIRKFSQEPEQFTLAISLHAATQWKRNNLMPQVSNQNLVSLKEELVRYIKSTGRRVTLEYLLIKNVNDQKNDLYALADFCKGLLCHVNLLTMNKVPGIALEPSGSTVAQDWKRELEKRKMDVRFANRAVMIYWVHVDSLKTV